MARLRCENAASVARSFLQIANRSYYSSSTAHASKPLDFLIPTSVTSSAPRNPQHSISFLRSHTYKAKLGQSQSLAIRIPSKRCFSVSAIRQQTRPILNSPKDEEGNDMMLEITPRAAKRLSQIMEKDANPNLALRIQVESGGCHGFQYLMSLITLPPKDTPEWSSTINEDDTIFQYVSEDVDLASASEEGPKIILDEPSLDLLKGSKVDFTMELIGSQFKIVDNPFATSSCGCGTSFDIKA
ncbi:hypothetical protein BGZ63DRAFT_427850 [Mariannaea sp. PMI_226]|nr:hypothetical protein BGZ63DRAFT_427850 [Mariannaea sp. PMI_226]